MGDLTANFSKHEFSCPCCGVSEVNMDFVAKLQSVRTRLDSPLRLNSTYRCFSHNRDVGGVDDSAHRKGLAADVSVANSSDRMRYLSVFLEEFKRIGIADDFIHVDLDDSKAGQNVIWLYPSKK